MNIPVLKTFLNELETNYNKKSGNNDKLKIDDWVRRETPVEINHT